MSTGTKIGILGFSATFLVGGVTLLLSVNAISARLAGVICIALAFITPATYWILLAFSAERVEVKSSVERAVNQLVSYTTALENTARRLGVQNNARFLPEGFLGLQKQCLVLEEDSQIGSDHVRMAILGHLPSYIRLTELSEERGRQLYHNWEPPHLVSDYVRLVNRRRSAMHRFIESGGIVREIYDKNMLAQYVAHRSTFHDKIQDPKEEILERLRSLLYFVTKPNYYICLTGDEEDAQGPHFLLKQDVGLVIDIRTPETQKHFTKSLDGLYTDSTEIMNGFEEKFRLFWKQIDKEKAIEFLEDLVNKIKG